MNMAKIVMGIFVLLTMTASAISATQYYIVSPNGMINNSWASTNSFSQLINNTNNDVGGIEGWIIAIIVFVIVLIGLVTINANPTAAAMMASFFAAGITMLESGFITYATINLQLYLFIALIVIFGVAFLLTGADRPYG